MTNRIGKTGAVTSLKSRRGGFTLLEILITMLMLAIVLPSVMGGISLSLRAAEYARQQEMASSLAQSKLTELLAQNDWTMPRLSGDFSPEHPEYVWMAELVDWDGGNLQELDITVAWKQGQTDRGVSLWTLVNTGGTTTP